MNTLKSTTFLELIRSKRIRIPKIQRDYAEGRRNDKVDEVRRTFLNALLRVVFVANEEPLHLDFVYGYDHDNAFEPLDGQQRLTTLFLLHWFFQPKGCKDLVGKDGKSLFTYETRVSSEEFCNEIILHDARILLAGIKDGEGIVEVIVKNDWFKWSWRKDPSIESMLVVLDEVLNIMKENNYILVDSCYGRLDSISFHLLDLTDLGQGDELYVKMNARGKQLSPFDVLKSTLEEEIQHQYQTFAQNGFDEVKREEFIRLENDWRRLIDSDWIDYFWMKRSIGADGKPNVSDVETKYMRLLLRLISVQFSRQDKSAELARLANSGDEKGLEKILPFYTAMVWKARTSNSDSCPFLNFQRLMNDMNALFFCRRAKSGTECFDFIGELDPDYSWDVDNPRSILDMYLEDSFTYPVRIGFYGILAFLRKFPIPEMIRLVGDDNIEKDGKRLEDFRVWVRFLRNCTISENCNDRFDALEKVHAAFSRIDAWIDEYASSGDNMRRFISNIRNEPGFERARLEEERLKARLQEEDGWRTSIADAEKDYYLRGQIACLLDWAENNGVVDKSTFDQYAKLLSKITGLFYSQGDALRLFHAAMLALGDYRFGKHRTFGITAVTERDYSWKRYLREKIDGCYAPGIKHFIDYWKENHSEIDDVKICCRAIISDLKPELNDWRLYMVVCPELFCREYALWGVIAEHDGHHFLARGKTGNSRGYEILLSFVYEHAPAESRCFHDSIQPTAVANSVAYSQDGHDYSLQVTWNGTYKLMVDDEEKDGLTADQVLWRLGLTMS